MVQQDDEVEVDTYQKWHDTYFNTPDGQEDDRVNTFLLREILVQLIAIKEAVQRRGGR
jgi:hypothetical protein